MNSAIRATLWLDLYVVMDDAVDIVAEYSPDSLEEISKKHAPRALPGAGRPKGVVRW
jgi:hypothetical protein